MDVEESSIELKTASQVELKRVASRESPVFPVAQVLLTLIRLFLTRRLIVVPM
jgi:hypothetical protein